MAETFRSVPNTSAALRVSVRDYEAHRRFSVR